MNKHLLHLLSIVLAFVFALLAGLSPAFLPPGVSASSLETKVAERAATGSLLFVENAGQYDEGARFLVLGGSDDVWLAQDAIWITRYAEAEREDQFAPPDYRSFDPDSHEEPRPRRGTSVKLSFVNANPAPRIEPFDRADATVSYFRGSDPDKWRPAVPVWAGVRYVDLYPGIDLEIYGDGPEWRWRMASRDAAADYSQVMLRVEGAEELQYTTAALAASTEQGELIIPLIVVEGGAGQGASEEAVTVQRDSPKTYVVNPLQFGASQTNVPARTADGGGLVFAARIGGEQGQGLAEIAVDAIGAIYFVGSTNSKRLPTTPGAFDRSLSGGYDAFVVKLDPSGAALVYSTFLGGSAYFYEDNDRGSGIAVDRDGVAYITGATNSSDFPVTPGAFDPTYNGYPDAFVAKLDPSGSTLVYASYLGGESGDSGASITLDSSGSAYVTGVTTSSSFPTTTGAFQTSPSGYTDAFVAKVNPSGSSLVYSTYLGGSWYDNGADCAVDLAGAAYCTGTTLSDDFPGRPRNGQDDAFVVKLRPSGRSLDYAFVIGGAGTEYGYGVAVDRRGAAYATGVTWSVDFPATPGAFSTALKGVSDGFVAKIDPSGSNLAYASYLGGSGPAWRFGGWQDAASRIVVDQHGAAYVSGITSSVDFPTTPWAFDTVYNGGAVDGFIAKLDPSGSSLDYGTFLGGGNWDAVSAMSVPRTGEVFVAGPTYSDGFPITPGAYDRCFSSDCAFVAKLTLPTYSISGRVTGAGEACTAGVVISAAPGFTTLTNDNGRYMLSDLPSGVHTVTPAKGGCKFAPDSSRPVIGPPDVHIPAFDGFLWSESRQWSLPIVGSSLVP